MANPSHGSLTGLNGATGAFTYTATVGYTGSDSFTFRANDGTANGNISKVAISVTSANAPYDYCNQIRPILSQNCFACHAGATGSGGLTLDTYSQANYAGGNTVTRWNNVITRINLPEGDPQKMPKGLPGLSSAQLAMFNTWQTSAYPDCPNGVANQTPIASSNSYNVAKDGSIAITLVASDPNGDALTYSIALPPAKGTFSGSAPNLTYRPNAGIVGPDSFIFSATDARGLSGSASISILITGTATTNNPPVANGATKDVPMDTSMPVTLSAADPDGQALTYTFTTPAHGTLGGTAPNLTFLPTTAYVGTDSFSFTVRDPAGLTATATVSLKIAPSYYQHVKPILDGRCVQCHGTGGIRADLPFQTYSQAKLRGGSINIEVQAGRMPPWKAAKDCLGLGGVPQEYNFDPSLSVTQKKLIADWTANNFMMEGDASRPGTSLPPVTTALAEVDKTLTIPKYSPTLVPDEYRCFPFALDDTKASYVTGFNALPQNPAIIHHIVAYIVPPGSAAASARAASGSDGKPGYTCFGGPIPGQAAVTGLLGVWTPGEKGMNFPNGTGITVLAGSTIVLQIHYNLANVSLPQSDQTAFQLNLQSKPFALGKNAFMDFLIPEDAEYLVIPAGIPYAAAAPFFFDTAALYTVYGIANHQHMLGKSNIFEAFSLAGGPMCLLKIPKWDFKWQQVYWLKKPVVVTGQDIFTLGCSWDNTAANQPDGGVPKTVTWGEGSRDEMCLTYVYYTKIGE